MRRSMNKGIVKEHLSPSTCTIQCEVSGEILFAFADDCESNVLPTEGTRVAFKRQGFDLVKSVKSQFVNI